VTPEECIEELAPAVVVRAALFPLQTLLRLADPAHAARAAEAGTRTTAAFEAAYDATLHQQRATLFAATLGDPRFERALCLTNEDLSRKLAANQGLPARRNKRARHLETTLYRYLARAVWRREPCDLWAGVALGRWGPQSSTTREKSRYALAPDLGPYQFIVQSLARTPAYVERGIYKLNPTLRFDREGGRWRYTDRVFTTIVYREWPSRPGVDGLLRALAGMAPLSLAGIAAELRRTGAEIEALDELLAAFHGLGLLVGGLAFPRTFSSAWEALTAMAPELRPEHARPWRSSVLRLRRICRRVERKLETISLEELHAALDEVRNVPVALAGELGVESPTLPRSTLRCDASLPFSVVLGPDVKARLARAVGEFDVFERLHGLDAAARAAHRTLMTQRPGARPPSGRSEIGRIRTQESAWREAGAAHLFGQRLQDWSHWLERGGQPRERDGLSIEIRPPPLGALVLRPGGGHEPRYEISGSTTEISASYARYGQLRYGLARRARQRFDGHPLHEWYRTTLAKVARAANVEVIEYVGPCEGMPNALARPRFLFPVWDRWAPVSPYHADRLRIDCSNRASVPLATVDGRPDRISLTCFSPVNLGYSEPYLESLLLSSFREIPSWAGPDLPMQCELAVDRPTPAVALGSGNTVRLRRTLIRDAALAELVAAGRSTRFLLWQALARKHAWPAFLLLGRDGSTPLPVVRDSPLALEAALEGIREGVSFLSVEEPDDTTWLVNDQGETLVAELIVPFLRRHHAWSELAAN
jgi:hypothetical protein